MSQTNLFEEPDVVSVVVVGEVEDTGSSVCSQPLQTAVAAGDAPGSGLDGLAQELFWYGSWTKP